MIQAKMEATSRTSRGEDQHIESRTTTTNNTSQKVILGAQSSLYNNSPIINLVSLVYFIVEPLVSTQLTNKNIINTPPPPLIVKQIDIHIVCHYSLLELFVINLQSTDMAEQLHAYY